MKRFKKPKTGSITVSGKELLKIKQEITDTAVGTASLLYMVAAKDEFGFTFEDIEKLFVRATRYAEYIDDHVISMKNLADDLEKETGIKIKWR